MQYVGLITRLVPRALMVYCSVTRARNAKVELLRVDAMHGDSNVALTQ
jgi:hypothetical protein